MTSNLTKTTGMLLVLLTYAVSLTAGANKIAVGQPFPELRLPSLGSGDALPVTSFRGQKLVLHIFASW